MSDYYGQASAEPVRRLAQPGNDIDFMNMMGVMRQDAMEVSESLGPQSLDEIVNQNADAMRRGSILSQYDAKQVELEPSMRSSMMDFTGASTNGPLNAFRFGQQPANQNGMMGFVNHLPPSSHTNHDRHQSIGQVSPNPHFANQGIPYAAMSTPNSKYPSPASGPSAVKLDRSANHVQSTQSMPLVYADPGIGTNMGGTVTPTFDHAQFRPPLVQSPLNPSYSGSPMPGQRPSLRRCGMDGKDNSSSAVSMRTDRSGSQSQGRTSASSPYVQAPNGPTPPVITKVEDFSQDNEQTPMVQQSYEQGSYGNSGLSWGTPSTGYPAALINQRQTGSVFKNAYSSTGFDMLTVLMKVATRPRPEINIGSVDMSCAFVVCDTERYDVPIVYCSENFERLTGYNKHEILGRNCRFLQAPDGKVEAGLKRRYVDDDSVLYLKNMISANKEAQISLINYRKGGQPFMNLLTTIPICWDSDVVKFIVGFQVDLVEQPGSVTSKNPDGSYQINYQRGLSMPKYVFNTPERLQGSDTGQTIPREDVSMVLSTIGSGESEMSRRIWDKVLLENTDDVVHVLSLKGLFLYLSPSSRKVLEYDAGELIGTALSSVCHPSDIVPVTRELKETMSGASVDVVFRIRRKHSGYMWFEGHGSLHTEQGKGRKCIILVGRERPVYTLSRRDVASNGGICESELWTKMSTSGMFLFVPTNVRSMLDRQPEELVGTSIQTFMRNDSKAEFGRALEIARIGKKASAKHEMINKRGQVLQAYSTVYPGDATEGQKPTFVIAQTRLLKYSRNNTQLLSRVEKDSASLVLSSCTMAAPSTAPPGERNTRDNPTSNFKFGSICGKVATHAGHYSLSLGHQDVALASEDNVFDELKTTRSTSWQFELRQMEKRNRLLAEEVQSLIAAKKKRKRRKGAGHLQKDCVNCHTRATPEWRRGPSGNRDLCNSCGLRWAKQNGRTSPRTPSHQSVRSTHSDKAEASPHSGGTLVPTKEKNCLAIADQKVNTGNEKALTKSNFGGHAAKVARLDLRPASNHFGGYPPKIEEVVEETS